METTHTIPIQEELTRAEIDAQWERNYRFFYDHEREFERQYPGLYIAVHENTVLATGENPGQLAGDMYRKYGNIPVYVAKPGNKEIETIHFPIID